MTAPASRDALGELHMLVAQRLKEKIASPNCETADLRAAMTFLKDNNIEALIEHSDEMAAIVEALNSNTSSFDEEDQDILTQAQRVLN